MDGHGRMGLEIEGQGVELHGGEGLEGRTHLWQYLMAFYTEG